MTLDEFKVVLRDAKLPKSVELNCFSMSFARPGGLKSMQLGYSVDAVTGRPLTGDGPTDWRASWCVFGQSFTDDPLFVDLAVPDGPVFTAEHGVGDWYPVEVAPNMGTFADLLGRLKGLCVGRENPVAFERNPIPADAIDELRTYALGKGADATWWTKCLILDD